MAFPSALCLSYFGALSTFKDHHRVAAPAPGLARPSCGGQPPGDPPPPRTPGFLPSGPGGGEAVGLRGLVQTSSGEHALSALASESWAAGEVARPPPPSSVRGSWVLYGAGNARVPGTARVWSPFLGLWSLSLGAAETNPLKFLPSRRLSSMLPSQGASRISPGPYLSPAPWVSCPGVLSCHTVPTTGGQGQVSAVSSVRGKRQ